MAGFTYYDGDLNLVNNDQFGTCTVESLDPLTVTYRINEGVTWSDGTQIDAADLILYWGAVSTHFNSGEAVIAPDGTTAEADADGLPIVLNPAGVEVPDAEVPYTEEGALPEGWTYKESTDVTFDAASESLELVTQFPEISDDGLAATITWDSFYVDFQQAGLIVGSPAHVVGQERARHRGPGGGQAGRDRRLPEQRRGGAEADLGVLEHRLRRHQPPRRPRPVPQRRRVRADLVRRGQPDDVRGEPALQLGPDAAGADDRLPHHR